MLKKILKVLGVLIAAVLIFAVVLIGWLSVTEYKPAAVEEAKTYDFEAAKSLSKEENIKLLSFNTGYAGLGEEADFFMDGGKNTTTGDTLCDEKHPVVLESMEFPEPVIRVAIEPKTKAGQEKMGIALAKLA